jgi:hypothetical protein
MNLPDPFPRWPPPWLEDHSIVTEETLAEGEGVALVTALRSDDRVLISVTWPTGRRYVLVDPVGTHPPEALRVGEPPGDADDARLVDGAWSQVLTLAKQLMDGVVQMPWGQMGRGAEDAGEPPPKRRPWRRGD